ncbi:MAG: gliding motility protein [Myxococcales bacterium]|nr:gliding motility protein [Myxococcales bacterium]
MLEPSPHTPGLPTQGEFAAAMGVRDQPVVAVVRGLIAGCAPTTPPVAASPSSPSEPDDQLRALEQLGRFIVDGPEVRETDVMALPGELGSKLGRQQLCRLELLTRCLELLPAAGDLARACLGAVLARSNAISLFAEVGLPNDRGLVAETSDRLARRWLPQPPDAQNLAALGFRILDDDNLELEDLVAIAGPVWFRLARALELMAQPSTDARDAVYLLAARLAALGLAEDIRARTPVTQAGISASPFLRLARASLIDLPDEIAACRGQLAEIGVSLEDAGVSVDLVYSLDTIERGLARMEALLPFATHPQAVSEAVVVRLVGQLTSGLQGERSFRSLLADNFRLLARKVIERAGKTGEHYVTTTRTEYWKMLASAGGGGVLTAGTAITKFFIKWAQLPPFIDGVASSLLYALSFIAIQLAGFTLATKQPSMTAAALAGTLREASGHARTSGLVELIAQISRSQFAAAVGNITLVVIVAFGFDAAHLHLTGRPFLDARSAQYTIASFHPTQSGTLWFAAFTGVLLWCSSLFSGWFENAIVFRRIPEALAHHRVGRRVGRRRMQAVADFVERQAAGFGGSVSLGVLLGMTPVFAKFVGLPIDVRHVTLSSGSLALAVGSLGFDGVTMPQGVAAAIGIGCIGLLNFGVSFVLALLVALRARDVPRGEWTALPGAVLRYFVRHPLRFFLPPRSRPAA